jgi:hypothetical protein
LKIGLTSKDTVETRKETLFGFTVHQKTRVLNILCSLALVVARPESAAKDNNLLGMIALCFV